MRTFVDETADNPHASPAAFLYPFGKFAAEANYLGTPLLQYLSRLRLGSLKNSADRLARADRALRCAAARVSALPHPTHLITTINPRI